VPASFETSEEEGSEMIKVVPIVVLPVITVECTKYESVKDAWGLGGAGGPIEV
jgi:hypothetical protein